MEKQAKLIIQDFLNSKTDDQLFESTGVEAEPMMNDDLRNQVVLESTLLQIKLEELQEMEVLQEATFGLGTYISRHFTGVDDNIEEKVRNIMKEIKTEEDRTKLIKQIDGMLSTARVHNVFSNEKGKGMSLKDYIKMSFKSIGMNSTTNMVSKTLFNSTSLLGVVSFMWKVINNASGRTGEFIKLLELLKKDVQNYKIPKQ